MSFSISIPIYLRTDALFYSLEAKLNIQYFFLKDTSHHTFSSLIVFDKTFNEKRFEFSFSAAVIIIQSDNCCCGRY